MDLDDPDSEIHYSPSAFGPERMKPLRILAYEGRVNPKGIPCLYLSDNALTSMSETRPWPGSLISLGVFSIRKGLSLADCCERPGKFLRSVFRECTSDELETVAWSEISGAFSRPVTRTDLTADYVPTQIISELLSAAGFDGVRYRSHLGAGFNYALFDLDSAELQSCMVYETVDVQFQFKSVLSDDYAVVNDNQQYGAITDGLKSRLIQTD